MIMYWVAAAVLGIIHLQALLTNIPWKVPIYVTCMLVIGTAYFFNKKSIICISVLGGKWNVLLFGLQLLLLLFYFSIKPSWIYLVPLIVFIGIESIRLGCARKLAALNQENQQFKEQTAHFSETFRIVRSERHDFLKHASAIHFMLENGKNNEAKAYLDELVDGYEETNLSIKGERGTVAGILNQMYRQAKAAGITMVYDFDLPLSTLPLADKHMVTLLGNLLANSIEACEDWQTEHKQEALITLQFYKRSGLFLLICKNNSLPIPTPILDALFQTYGKTTKRNGHEGLGTKMIHDIVSEHHGFLDFVYKEQEFTVKIKFPAIQ
ncbi:GHKL domain-containing protein [Neobacillus novalis]|uniref:GHKL domain-containing protein n=1 Tax=Neobacillus novalis TaxID=220687 RepID=A0AA95SB76_9BACI|nr:GHKL domain-containing protein [Neobacillus novalis]WHY88935.1 GHKL domain-containing protein [Neobacillus novalis]